eukprot:UN16139
MNKEPERPLKLLMWQDDRLGWRTTNQLKYCDPLDPSYGTGFHYFKSKNLNI